MGLLDFLLRRDLRRGARAPSLLRRLAEREGGGARISGAADEERALGERLAAELHAYGTREPPGLGRRGAAIASAARRRRADELAEALAGLQPWELPALLEALRRRPDVDLRALAATAVALAESAVELQPLALALGLLGLAPATEHLPLFEQAARSPALAAVCALAAEPLGVEALLRLARVADGIGRAMLLERLGLAAADDPGKLAPLAGEALRLAGAVADEPARAYAAVPLLEIADVPALLAADPGLAEPVAACLEGAARGGWNGGPGPGLGRLPGAIRAAEALLQSAAPLEVRQRGARAVLASHPLPPGPSRRLALELAGDEG